MPEVLDAASRELAANAVWYEERRSGYGSRFIDEAEAMCYQRRPGVAALAAMSTMHLRTITRLSFHHATK